MSVTLLSPCWLLTYTVKSERVQERYSSDGQGCFGPNDRILFQLYYNLPVFLHILQDYVVGKILDTLRFFRLKGSLDSLGFLAYSNSSTLERNHLQYFVVGFNVEPLRTIRGPSTVLYTPVLYL